jgi:hypothetical protein
MPICAEPGCEWYSAVSGWCSMHGPPAGGRVAAADGILEDAAKAVERLWAGSGAAWEDAVKPMRDEAMAAVRALKGRYALEAAATTAGRLRVAAIWKGLRGGHTDPNRCVCAEKEPIHRDGGDTPHRHYEEPPFACARGCGCKAWEPAVNAAVYAALVGQHVTTAAEAVLRECEAAPGQMEANDIIDACWHAADHAYDGPGSWGGTASAQAISSLRGKLALSCGHDARGADAIIDECAKAVCDLCRQGKPLTASGNRLAHDCSSTNQPRFVYCDAAAVLVLKAGTFALSRGGSAALDMLAERLKAHVGAHNDGSGVPGKCIGYFNVDIEIDAIKRDLSGAPKDGP